MEYRKEIPAWIEQNYLHNQRHLQSKKTEPDLEDYGGIEWKDMAMAGMLAVIAVMSKIIYDMSLLMGR